MKRITVLIFLISLLCTLNLFSQTRKVQSGKFTYETVDNDPLNTRIYTLENGFKVYLSVNRDAPRIETRIVVRAGSKNDPPDATGLAHYLEHMLFKGTSKFGTMNYEKEKIELNNIISLFDVYRKTTDSLQRKSLYRQIDSISYIASGYAIPNEYDKMMSMIGATGTNAYTSEEQTCYVNDIPSNQLERWLVIEAERFREPVMRLFHTELEVVYEEKNRGLDNGVSKAYENLYAGLFQKHTYGTQTTIGTIEHLKNPSIQKVIDYYYTYYVPNNMAMCLAGDFNPDEAIELIDGYFGVFQKKNVPEFIPPVEDEITEPVIKEVYSPDAERLFIGFRFKGANTEDADLLGMTNYILYNGTAGLIDLNLVQAQKVLSANSFPDILKDYSSHIFTASPREGQKLEEVRDLILSQIERIKKGDFPDWYLKAAINNIKLDKIKSYESNSSRVGDFVSAFVLGMSWEKYVNRIDRLAGITKQQIVEFANKYYGNNYVIVYKRTGEDKNVLKVVKPEITPVQVNREVESDYFNSIKNFETKSISPVFLDFTKDFNTYKIKADIPLYFKFNTSNKLFSLYYLFDMGTNNDKMLTIATNYLKYLGTSKYSPAQFKQEMFKLGCSFNVFNSDRQVYVSLSGLSENMESSLKLFESLLSDAQPNQEALANLVNDIVKSRNDAKLSKRTILYSAMMNYGYYGKKSPFTNILLESELRNLSANQLINLIKSISSYKHEIIYYGPENSDDIISMLDEYHNVPEQLKPVPKKEIFGQKNTETKDIYVVNYDMKQVEIIMISKQEAFDKNNLAYITLFNEYFGSIVFQELREAKALAYSVYAQYTTPKDKIESHYIFTYIGAQADKLGEAMNGMFDLLNNMPESEIQFNSAKNGVLEQIRTERILKTDIIFRYLQAKEYGINYDIRKDIYKKVPEYTLMDLKDFHKKFVKDKDYIILVLGDKNKIDKNILEKYGSVSYLTLEEIFGY